MQLDPPAGLQGLNVNLVEVALPTGLQSLGVGVFNLGSSPRAQTRSSPDTTSLMKCDAFKENALTREPSG